MPERQPTRPGTTAATERPRPSVRDVFLAFLRVGLYGFGGVMPHARSALVDRHGWVTDREMTDILTLAQLLPGPNIVNVSIMIGVRFRGAAGAVAGVLGLLGTPLVIVLALGATYLQFADEPWLKGAFAGVGAAAAGLIVSVGVRLAHSLRPQPLVILFGATAFAVIALTALPPPLVVLALAPLGVWIAWRAER
jgi:chromate transporter